MAKTLKYYDVKLEATVPAVLTYRILADSPEQALELSERASPVGTKYTLARKRKIKATVYDAGTLMMRVVKNFIR